MKECDECDSSGSQKSCVNEEPDMELCFEFSSDAAVHILPSPKPVNGFEVVRDTSTCKRSPQWLKKVIGIYCTLLRNVEVGGPS